MVEPNPDVKTGAGRSAALFALTIFTGAFLLFLVQPLIGKYILPWFGGGPAVWTACLLFFQVVLLLGYAYAHLLTTMLAPRGQFLVHLLVLGVGVALLPISPAESWKPRGDDDPTLRILLLLTATIGVQYFALSATGPLIQAWFSRVSGGRSPYRLYALSNVGSLLALLGYPFVLEWMLPRQAQALSWSAGLGVFAVLCVLCAWMNDRAARAFARAGEPTSSAADDAPPGGFTRAMWLLLPACAVLLLMAFTNKLCQDVATIPFLWVLPLALYLLTFIICFDSPRWYVRGVWIPLLIGAAALVGWMLFLKRENLPGAEGETFLLSIRKSVAFYGGVMFVFCMVLHGELYRLRPSARRLTGYYLTISAGGALGGVAVAIGAPAALTGYYELQIGLAIAAGLVLAVLYRPLTKAGGAGAFAWAACAAAGLFFGQRLYASVHRGGSPEVAVIDASRNFYGANVVYEHRGRGVRYLYNAGISHGEQFLDPDLRYTPTTYYTPLGGAGLAITQFPRQANQRVGVVGLGVGTLATYARPGDYYRLYEINPHVIDLAQKHFTFLADCLGDYDLVLGDARLSMEREESQSFDILVLDAFTGDSVPAHLLTREAFEIYLRHLRPDGVIAIHISNPHLDLQPVVTMMARHLGMGSTVIESQFDQVEPGGQWSKYMLLTRNQAFLDKPMIRASSTRQREAAPWLRLWTDDDSNLFQLLRRK